jgi:hypothetical protein
MVHKVGDFRAPDLVLAGQAVGVGTRAADELAFDDGGAAARFGHMPGKELTSLSAAKHEQVKLFCFGHKYHLLHMLYSHVGTLSLTILLAPTTSIGRERALR